VRILLDTQIWLWMLSDPDRLSGEGRRTLEDAGNDLLLSAASTWEISIKSAIGKLQLPGLPEKVVPRMIRQTMVTPLPVHHSHTLRVASLVNHHSDPFDRLLVAQAQMERVPIMTADAMLREYDVDCLTP